MTTPSTPRLTLPDPNRAPMTPLPAELLARILRCAQEGQTAEEQLKTRLNFEKVCKAWFLCDFRWRVVALNGLESAESFAAVLAGMASLVRLKRGGTRGAKAAAGLGVVEDAAAKVKTLHLRVPQVKGTEKRSNLGKLLSSMVNLSTVDVSLDYVWRANYDEGPGAAAVAALSNLRKVTDFVIGGVAGGYTPVPNKLLIKFTSKWPQLESFRLKNCYNRRSGSDLGIFKHSSALTKIVLEQSGECADDPRMLLLELPPSARTLIVNSASFYLNSSTPTGLDGSDQFLSSASKLTSVTLTDGKTREYDHSHASRSQLDTFIRRLDSVVDLAINPCAVSDLVTLAELKSLVSLEVLIGLCTPWPPVESSEVVNLLNDSTKLTKLTLSEYIAKDWTAQQKQDVEDAAQSKVNLTWV